MTVRSDTDRGSLPLALLLILVAVTVTAALVPVVIQQTSTTRTQAQRSGALRGAQAGLDVALGHLRGATDTRGAGVLALMPCGPLAGSVSAAGPSRYRVVLDYVAEDPTGRADDWLATHRIVCTPGVGPASSPAYVVLTSTGTDVPSGAIDSVAHRVLRATYPVQRSGQTFPGGFIHAYRTSATAADLCLDAGSATPATGTTVRLRTCGAVSGAQTFLYAANLTLVLVSSRTATLPLGMCLDAGTPHARNRAVQLRPCASTTLPQQQWILNDWGNLEGTADGSTADGYCFNVQQPGRAGSAIILDTAARRRCRQGPDTQQTFLLDSDVGTGAAGAAGSGQVVNRSQVSRCLTVTGGNPSAAYLVVPACQQSTDPSRVSWVQRWQFPAAAPGQTRATGLVVTENGGQRHCLRSPGAPGAGRYVTLQPCPGNGTPPALTWTVFGNTGDPATSFQVRDQGGYCLSPTDPAATPPDLHSPGFRISKLILAGCTGADAQKWNAGVSSAATAALVTLQDVHER